MTFKIDDAAGPTIQVDQVKTAAVPTNNSFGSLIGLPSVFTNTPYRGNGYAVAFIDTGIDYKNANLGGGFGPGYRVVAGWDFANNDADPLDDNGHGTHVAGIVGSSHATYSGVAPNVNLIALKVLDKRGGGTFGNVESALQWVAANRARYNIVAVNLSLGTGNYTANPFTFMDDEFTALKNGGVFISVAAGNSFYAYNSAVGLDYPAISPLVVSVGAVWAGNFGTVAWANGARDNSTAADRIASFSQRGPALSIMSPGAIITSTYLNNTLKGMSGTSMASPVIAGAAVLIHQAMDALKLPANQDTILSVLKKTGVNVKDGDDENDNVVNTGLTFKRLDLNTALKSLGTPTNSAPMLQTIADATVAPGGTRVITLSGSDPNGDAITFSASVVGAGPSQAYQLKQQLGLTYLGSYYQNAWGQNEKWLSSTNRTWYAILPSGQLRRWAGSMTATLQAANLIATLDPSFYADPSKLWNAQPPSAPPLTLSISGNRLTIAAPTNAGGSYQIQVTASDGKAFTTQSFRLTIQADAPASNWALVSSGDFNGDGKADVLAFDKAGSLWVGIATAKGTALARWTQWAAASLWSSLNVADVNGDGKADFVGKYANGKWYVAYSTGAAFRTQSWTGSTAPITK
jgi:subtilisin family serine protease